MARLWKIIGGKPWLVNPKRVRRRVRTTRGRRNPLGDTLVTIGALAGNPRRTRKGVKPMKKRRYKTKGSHRARRNPHRGRVRYPRTRGRYRRNRARRVVYRHRRNPGRRHYRRNPEALAINMWRPMTWFPFALTAGLSATATAAAPRLIFGAAVAPTQAYLTQAGIAVGGGLLLPMLGLKKAHGVVWFLTGVAIIVADTVGRYAMKALGLSAYPQFPYYPARLSGTEAYPYQALGQDGLEAYEPVPGAPVAPFDVPYGASVAYGM